MYIDFDGSAAGPLWGPNFVMVGYDDNGVGHTLQIFPDICNDELRNAGKPMYFYIMPNSVRMAKNDQGKSMFHFTKFAGILTQDSNIGTKGQEEVAGGVMSLTSTLELPPAVINSVKDQIKAEIKKNPGLNSHPLFRFRQDSPPAFELGFVPIEQNEVAVSNLSLEDVSDPAKQPADDKWLWRMQGQGLGSLDPNGTNACTAMVGQFPAALIEAGFKGDSSPIFIHNALKLRFRTPSIKIKVHADYQKIYNAYTQNTKYKDDWNQINIHKAFEENNLSGFCKTTIMYGDLELTEKDKQTYEDMAQQAKNAIMTNVTKFIFDKQPDTIAQAEADPTHSRQRVKDYSLFWGLVNHYSTVDSDEGYSYALNKKFDSSKLQLDDETEIQGPYFVTTVVSGDMKGFFQEFKANPDAVKEYFDFVNLGDAFRKIHVIATSRANWPDTQGGGDPLDKLAISVGYSDKDGVVQYKDSGRYYDNLSKKLSDDFEPSIWTKDDQDRVFVFDFAVDDNVPKEKRNQISIKRRVAYKMDDRVKVNPDNEIVVPDETTTDTQIEVRADVLGHLNVGPIYLSADLNKHMLVEVTFATDGFEPVTLMFTPDNATVKQRFQVWTGKATAAIAWTYKTRVTYKSFGPLAAIQYEGAVVNMQGSFPNGISINLPNPPDNIIQQLTTFKQQSKELDALDA
jgi:hypothetical protein